MDFSFWFWLIIFFIIIEKYQKFNQRIKEEEKAKQEARIEILKQKEIEKLKNK